ncbi:hypothetical protein [Phytoactinopolyspora halophila]|nr:hypothetical protein [Phytoactinopolyspora halophila]
MATGDFLSEKVTDGQVRRHFVVQLSVGDKQRYVIISLVITGD